MVQRFRFYLIACLCTIMLSKGSYKEGDAILAGLFTVHFKGKDGLCGSLFLGGLGQAESMRFAIDKINKDSNLLSNITLGYDIRDYCENTTQAMQATLELVTEDCTNGTSANKKPIVALVGPHDSGTALAVGGVLEVFHIPGISGTTSSTELTSHVYRNFYRTIPSDSLQAEAMADIIEHFNWTYVAAVGLDDSYGKNGLWALHKEASNRKTFCVAYAEFVPKNFYSKNITSITLQLKQYNNINVIVLWMYGGYGRAFFAEANKQNLTGRVWLLSEGLTSEGDLVDRSLSILDGSIGIQPHHYDVGGFQDFLKAEAVSKGTNNIAKWWKELWSVKKGCMVSMENGSSNGTKQHFSGPTCSHVFQDMQSAFIPYVIDAVYSVAHALDKAYKQSHSSGNHWQPLHAIQEIKVQENMRFVAFDGVTGKVQFNGFGDSTSAYYDIVNFQRIRGEEKRLVKKILVGKWEKHEGYGNLSFSSKILWNSDSPSTTPPKSDCVDECQPGTRKSITSPCCWQCVPCLPGSVNPISGSSYCIRCPLGMYSNELRTSCVDLPMLNVEYSSTSGIILLLLAACGFVITFLIALVFSKFWETPIVKASNRELSLSFLAGIVSLFCLAITNIAEPTVTLCKVRYAWRYTTYILCTTILLIKILEIKTVFRMKVKHWFDVGVSGARRKVIALLISETLLISILVPWYSLDPPVAVTVIKPEEHTFIECKAYKSMVGKALFTFTCLYIFIQTVLCAYCAFKVRKIPENFSETKRIAFSMYIYLLSLLTYHPVEFSIGGWYVTVIDCVTTLLAAFGFLGFIFLPKVYIILLKPHLNNLDSMRSAVSQYSFQNTSVHVENGAQ